jgi:hypothetical protein
MPEYLNSFRTPVYVEQTILGPNGNVIGTIRIKPSSVMWKPANAAKFYRISLDRFTAWIMDMMTVGVTRTKS